MCVTDFKAVDRLRELFILHAAVRQRDLVSHWCKVPFIPFCNSVDADKDGMLSVDYIGVIPLLVNAIQELKGRLEQVEAEKEMATPAVNHAPAVTATADVLAAPAAEVLSQNDPNPFSSDTRIAYNLPEGTQQAAIYIYDLQGKQVKRLDVSPAETGTMLHGGDLQAGMYIYSLIADGKELASKKMILTK